MSQPSALPALTRRQWALLGAGIAVSLLFELLRVRGIHVPGWRWLQSLLFAHGLLHWMACASPGKERRPWLLPFGTTAVVLGGIAAIGSPDGAQVVAIGSLVCLAWAVPRARGLLAADSAAAAALAVAALGLVIDLGAGLAWSGMAPGLKGWLGADDDLRLRWLRLARAACATLPALLLLYRSLRPERSILAERLFLFGAAGMPLILLLAAGAHPVFKYLLWIPADALVIAVGIALARAARAGRWGEAAGWTPIALSMVLGLLLGGFAFEGPLPAPRHMGDYHDALRSLLRVGHAYAVIGGVMVLLSLGPAPPKDEQEVAVTRH